MNNLLANHPLKLSNDALRQHVLAFGCTELHEFCLTDSVRNTVDYADWKALLDDFDTRQRNDRTRCEKELEIFLKKRPTPASSCAPTPANGNGKAKSVPALTQAEREFLKAQNCCLKCRRYPTDHYSNDCLFGFSEPATYKPLVVTGGFAPAASSSAAKPKPKSKVAAVTEPVETTVAVASVRTASPAAISSSVLGIGEPFSDDSDGKCVYPPVSAIFSGPPSSIPPPRISKSGCLLTLGLL